MSMTLSTILAILGFSFVLETVLDLLDLKFLKERRFPPGIENHYGSDELDRALSYHRDWRRFSILKRTCSAVLFFPFILFGGFGAIDEIARQWAGFPKTPREAFSALLFAALLMLIKGVLDLPFAAYGTFVIEERYGFNKTTPRTFASDILKGILLSALIGAPIYLSIVWFFERTGPSGWVSAWVAFSAFQLVLVYLAPVLLMPLFNRFSPLPKGDLRSAIDDFCGKIDFRISGVYQMDGSRRSTKANAFFTGFGKFRRLVLFDTLIQKLSIPELMAVLAHEIGHFRGRHIQLFLLISILSTGLSFYVFSFFIGSTTLTEALAIKTPSTYATLIIVGVLYSPVTRLLGVAVSALSRRFEYQADRFSAIHYGAPETLASALLKISTDALANPAPHPLRVALDYSHPPVPERIAALKKFTTRSAHGP